MMVEVPLKCSCGKVKGTAYNVSPDNGTRVVCYCKSCQDFANSLENNKTTLNDHGGTDIFQITPAQVEITHGRAQLRCLRLSEKGTYRWYTDCCKTPVGNMAGPGLPFIGVVHTFMDDGDNRDKYLGPVKYSVMEKDASPKSNLPKAKISSNKFPPGLLLTIIPRMILNKIRGRNQPNAFFQPDGTPVSPPFIQPVQS
ncbi:DUF6151 family protein [Kiloniella antarctica]|uniref:DUF6151 family protein n=1 Tax=Kiloniella antarctica TaxID=1550907 RepID=A0ABW5BL87_9PROT